MGLDRRTFLQQAGLALFAWGTTEIGLDFLGRSNNRLAAELKNYQQTLAQSTNRKLALLVGVNRYPHQEHLDGCLTDLELQRELLIHRFGFNPQDIITLSDRAATRENIETAFVEHLSQQAKTDDVVVFHFSGYGGQIKMPLASEIAIAEELDSVEYKLVNSLMPVDGLSQSKKSEVSNSILQETLLLLAQSLSTSKCTFVLDTSFNLTPRAKHSHFKIRSATKIAESSSPQELAFLEELRSKFADKGLKPSKRLLSLPGVVFSASSKNQIAVERQWDGFSAGLFTQALTQHLWQITPSNKVQVALAATAATVEGVMGKQQQPTLNSPDKSAIAYYLATSDLPQATGAIDKINKNNLEIKLLGLPANILDRYGVNSCLSLAGDETSTPELQIKSRDGLLAKAQILNPSTIGSLQVGDFVRESLRILNRNLGLTLGLDADLGRIERVDATSALANITAVDSTVTIGEQNADCLLGKVAREKAETEERDSETFSYGLYTAGGRLIGKTSGTDEEAVKIAIDRLQPHFNNLLAVKWLELTNNEFSSRLPVNVSLASGDDNLISISNKATYLGEKPAETTKKISFPSKNPKNPVPNTPNSLPILVKGSNLQLSIDNYGDRELHLLLFGIDTDRNLLALHTPLESKKENEDPKLTNLIVPPKGELTIPTTEDSWQWKVPDSIGINTLYAVLSPQPFNKTLTALATEESFPLDRQQILNVSNAIAVVKSLMEDLHSASAVAEDFISNKNNDVYALNVNSWATLNFVYEIANG